jgi:uncharacterized protein YajQ (UPF0234 family)
MDLDCVAIRVAFGIEAAKKKKKVDFLTSQIEYSAHIDLSISINFFGGTKTILKSINTELKRAIKEGMHVVANDFELQSSDARVKFVKNSIKRLEDTKKQKSTSLAPKPSYLVNVGVSIIVDFEGEVDKDDLEVKIQNELTSSVQNGLTVVANKFDLKSTTAKIEAVNMELAVNDETAIDTDLDIDELEKQ